MILAGDLGGTKANLGLFEVRQGKLVRIADKRYATREHSGLEEIASDFLNGSRSKITAASFGIAGAADAGPFLIAVMRTCGRAIIAN